MLFLCMMINSDHTHSRGGGGVKILYHNILTPPPLPVIMEIDKCKSFLHLFGFVCDNEKKRLANINRKVT